MKKKMKKYKNIKILQHGQAQHALKAISLIKLDKHANL